MAVDEAAEEKGAVEPALSEAKGTAAVNDAA
jgi:hypothetical protein